MMILKIKDALETINHDNDLIIRTELLLRADKQKKKVSLYRNLAVAASILLVLSTVSVAGYGYYQTPVSYLDVDINPSLELGINAFDRVVKVVYFNTDAEDLISEDKLSGCNPNEAVSLIVDAADEKGYIHQNEVTVVSLAAVSNNDEKAQTLLDACSASVESTHEDVAVYSAMLSDDLKSEAETASMSAGKLNLIKMIQELDNTATVDDYKSDSVTEIFDRLIYLTSDESKSISEEKKTIVKSGIGDITDQIDRIQDKNKNNNAKDKASVPTNETVQSPPASEPSGGHEQHSGGKGQSSSGKDYSSDDQIPHSVSPAQTEKDNSKQQDVKASPSPEIREPFEQDTKTDTFPAAASRDEPSVLPRQEDQKPDNENSKPTNPLN